MNDNPQLAEALFPALDSMKAADAQPTDVFGNADGFVFGSKTVPSQAGAALDGASTADQPAVDARGNAYLWRSLGITRCAAYAFGAGVEAGASGGCVEGAALPAGASCDVKCGSGYASQGEVTISCAADAAAGAAIVGAIASGAGCTPGAFSSPFPRPAPARLLPPSHPPPPAAQQHCNVAPLQCGTNSSPQQQLCV